MAATDARPVPRKNAAYRVTFGIYDADGDLVTAAAALDSEVSIDGGAFVDCLNEATEIATSSGIYFLDLPAAEMNGDTIGVIVKTTTTGAKTTALILYPQEAGDIRVDVDSWAGVAVPTTEAGGPGVVRRGTAQGGAAQSITLDAGASATNDKFNGGLVEIIGGTGVGEARQITDYDGTSKVATVDLVWVTIPDATSVFRVFANSLGTTAEQLVDLVWNELMAEPSAVPAVTAQARAALAWLLALARNKITQTATTQALRNDADAANIATATVSDDGTTFTRNEWV